MPVGRIILASAVATKNIGPRTGQSRS